MKLHTAYLLPIKHCDTATEASKHAWKVLPKAEIREDLRRSRRWRHARLDITWCDQSRPKPHGSRSRVVHGLGAQELLRGVKRAIESWQAEYPGCEPEGWLLFMDDAAYRTGRVGVAGSLSLLIQSVEDAKHGLIELVSIEG